ncbi:uncharacterized protein LOC114189955 [Vigna unguiculata]|uniref:uncharacterized protein LOC114189955 n=1 Tax=Vigna unguiculata TaxID=3917 RepID=UPI001015F9EB|nr:uncharacterized protein LOC114189955 [Vigna unguiculata]
MAPSPCTSKNSPVGSLKEGGCEYLLSKLYFRRSRLRGRPISQGEGWVLNVKCGYHNHDVSSTLVGHPYAGRLKSTEQSLLVDMTKSQVKPANILLTLKEKDDCNVTTLKQVYNARYRYKRSIRGSRTELQQLMLMLERDHYIHFSRCLDESDVVSDLFWTHPDAVKLLNSFNIVFLMDSTYKTNKYRLPLLEIVGVTSTGLTFSAAFAFLSSEKQNNFIWALERLRGLFMTSEGGPQVIVTDRDLALMNVVGMVFPECYHLLCRFHIQKNVQAKCKMLVNSVDAWDVVLQAWENVMDCEDELKFNECVHRLELVCQPWPVFFEYVNDSWIIPYKKFFVRGIQSYAFGEYNIKQNDMILGLFLSNVMWTRLSFSNVSSSQSEGQLSIQKEVDLLLNLFKEVDIAGKVTIKHKLLDIVCPSMTSMLPPPSKVKTKGAAKSHRSKKSTKRDPSYFEHVDAFIESSRQDTCAAKTENKLKSKRVIEEKMHCCVVGYG